jgi:hypothetical protein
MSGPLNGARVHQMLAIVCVALSLALVALGCSDPTGVFHLGTLSFCRPLGNHGAVLDTVVGSHDVDGVSCEESSGA